MKRFELSTLSWQGDALPLSYIRSVTLGLIPRDLMSMQHEGALGQVVLDEGSETLRRFQRRRPLAKALTRLTVHLY